MTRRSEHDEHHDDIGAYLLGAMPPLEMQVLERHIMGCPSCRDALEYLRPAVDDLARSVEQFEAPPSLRASVLAIVKAKAEPGVASEAAARRAVPARRWWRPHFAPRLRPAMGWVSAAFIIAAGGVAGWGLARGTEEEARTIQAKVELSRGSGDLVVSGDGESGAILKVRGLPPNRPGETYQVWVKRGGEVIPSSLFRVYREDGTGAAAIPGKLEDDDAVFVTREPDGGARQPTEAPIISADL